MQMISLRAFDQACHRKAVERGYLQQACLADHPLIALALEGKVLHLGPIQYPWVLIKYSRASSSC